MSLLGLTTAKVDSSKLSQADATFFLPSLLVFSQVLRRFVLSAFSSLQADSWADLRPDLLNATHQATLDSTDSPSSSRPTLFSSSPSPLISLSSDSSSGSRTLVSFFWVRLHPSFDQLLTSILLVYRHRASLRRTQKASRQSSSPRELSNSFVDSSL